MKLVSQLPALRANAASLKPPPSYATCRYDPILKFRSPAYSVSVERRMK